MMNSGLSASDVALLSGSNNRGNDGMWGGDWASWIILFLIFGMFGWGGFGGFNGWGGGFGGQGGAMQGYATQADIQRGFDNQAVITKLDGITQGICDSTYALNNAITNGFNNTNTAMLQGFNAANVTALQGFNGVERGFCNLSSQLANCCCENREAIAQVRYDMATQACDTRNTIQNTTRDILDNNNANTRAILDFLTQDKIATLQAENQSLKFQASQTAQNAFIAANQTAQTAELIRRLGADCPIPAYVVPNPNCCYGNPVGVNYGYNSGCGCNNGYNSGCGCA